MYNSYYLVALWLGEKAFDSQKFRGGNCSPSKFFGRWKFFKSENCPPKALVFWKFRGIIKILSTHNHHQKFFNSCQNYAGNSQCLKIATFFVPFTFLTHDAGSTTTTTDAAAAAATTGDVVVVNVYHWHVMMT